MAFRAAASPAEDGAGWLAVLAAALTALAAAAALLLILRSIGRCFRTWCEFARASEMRRG
jgi:hypothetical protein